MVLNYTDYLYSSFIERKTDSVFKEFCDSDIIIEELDQALKKFKTGKASGQDLTLTSIFYKYFWKELKEFLFEAIKDVKLNETLTSTMKQGFITLIPKPGKAKRLIDHLRPITLLNTDYKILTHVIAKRLKDG